MRRISIKHHKHLFYDILLLKSREERNNGNRKSGYGFKEKFK